MTASQAPNGATHYEILNITPALLDTQHNPAALIKRAYHRALLRNHPDKATTPSTSTSTTTYTIDQITTALTTLSSPASRAAYDAALRVSRPSPANPRAHDDAFQTGIENVDLDDLVYDDADACWSRPCRCGNDRGYLFREADLEEVGDEGELVVGCLDCSLWLRVHFAVVEEDEDHEDEKGDDGDKEGEEASPHQTAEFKEKS